MISVEQDSLLAPTPQPLSPELQRLLELTTYTSNLILYGPPGTGKTWRVRALGKHLAASQPATTTNAGAGVGQPLRAWMLITNDDWVLDDGQKWKWADFLTSGTEFFSTRRRFASAFEQASDNDLVFCYRATPVKKLVAVAKVVQQYHEEDEEMGVTIGQISPLTNPIPWATLSSRLQLRSNDVQATFRPLSEEQTAGLVQLCREAGNDLTLPTTEAEEDALLNLTQATEAHSNVEFVTFHQSFAYEDFVEGLKPQIRGGQLDYVVEPGVFRRICTAAEAHPDEHYLLVIDEINRANIAKVFGELITLIEDDKRLTWNPDAGRWEGMRVQLPYSKQQFGVPDNLLLVGTMNTADRSIALLDIALRRRFAFALVPPEPTLLKPLALTEGSLDLSQLLSVLNERVAALLDDDHRIGHSYLMRIGSLAGLRFAWYQRIIPLLEEYFYHDGERLRKVLGGAFVTQTKLSEAAKKALGDLADSSFRRYEVKREMSDADFLGALQRLAANTQVGEGAGEMSED